MTQELPRCSKIWGKIFISKYESHFHIYRYHFHARNFHFRGMIFFMHGTFRTGGIHRQINTSPFFSKGGGGQLALHFTKQSNNICPLLIAEPIKCCLNDVVLMTECSWNLPSTLNTIRYPIPPQDLSLLPEQPFLQFWSLGKIFSASSLYPELQQQVSPNFIGEQNNHNLYWNYNYVLVFLF